MAKAKSAGKKAAAKPAKRAAKPAGPTVRKELHGVITHTELASADPVATRTWCQKALGWKFGDAVPTPSGPYHMWRFDNGTGGGIRSNAPREVPGSIPYCEVNEIKPAYAKALAAGATEMLAPQALPGGMGWIAVVAAPGGVTFGLWAAR